LTNCHVREDQPAKPGEIRQGSRQAALVQAFFWGGGGGGRMMIPRHPVISPDEGMSGLPNTYVTVAKTCGRCDRSLEGDTGQMVL